MKKLVASVICVMTLCMSTIAYAQNHLYMNITEIEDGALFGLCTDMYDSITISKDPDCNYGFAWRVSYFPDGPWGNSIYPDEITIPLNNTYTFVQIEYGGCGVNDKWFQICPLNFEDMPGPFVEDVLWKRPNKTILLNVYSDIWQFLNYLWQDGSTGIRYTVTEPGTYWVRMYVDCGELSDTIRIRNDVEVYRATVDLETNLNKTTWQVTEEQAEYISQVKVYRDGFFVGTAPYENGYFLDAIGSDNAARNYQIVGVTPEGEDCPIASYQKGTIHTTYYLDVNDNLNMTWNIPYVEQGAQGTLTYFQVCKYDPITEQLTVVDQVNSLITDYTCGVNQFAGGYPVIAAVFSDAKNRDFEDLSFSNMYTDIAVQPQEITISLAPGWNWISYPYAVSKGIGEALGDFIPVEGDIIKSRLVSSSYTNGRWRGGVNHFTPGWGYMYYSSRNEPATLVFDISR